MIDLFLVLLALVWLIIASVSDLKKQEVPNWLSFSLLLFALSYRAIYSIFSGSVNFFIYGLFGLGIFLLIGEMFYYSRIFAGGDAKLLMSLGAVLPFASGFYSNFFILIGFVLLLLLAGSVYGLLWSFILALKNTEKFSKEFSKQFNMRKSLIFLSFVLALVLVLVLIFLFDDAVLFLLPLIIFTFPFLFIYGKAVEESCMVKMKNSKEVVVGDWLYEEVNTGKKKIKPNWEGLDEKEVDLLLGYSSWSVWQFFGFF